MSAPWSTRFGGFPKVPGELSAPSSSRTWYRLSTHACRHAHSGFSRTRAHTACRTHRARMDPSAKEHARSQLHAHSDRVWSTPGFFMSAENGPGFRTDSLLARRRPRTLQSSRRRRPWALRSYERKRRRANGARRHQGQRDRLTARPTAEHTPSSPPSRSNGHTMRCATRPME